MPAKPYVCNVITDRHTRVLHCTLDFNVGWDPALKQYLSCTSYFVLRDSLHVGFRRSSAIQSTVSTTKRRIRVIRLAS